MELTLENQQLQVEISSMGAELQSIVHKESGREYLWGGNPEVWGRRSPILFPNCGTVKDKQFLFDGKPYPAKQHGFARDLNHNVVCMNPELATFRLEANDATREFYPYSFALKTTYKLEKNSLSCQHKVINYDSKPISFSFGFHTGLCCPFVPGTRNTDYRLVMEKQEDCPRLTAAESGLIHREELRYKPDSRMTPITPGLYTNSLILKNPASRWMQLEEVSTGDYIRIEGTNSPYTVLWSAPEDIGVVCIEPWYGMGDLVDASGEFKDKLGAIQLESMGEFTCEQRIVIHVNK